MTIMKEAVNAVMERRNDYVEAQQYYQGDVPETFATAKLRRVFATTGDRSRLNFCRPIVNAVSNRLEVASIQGDTKAATAKISEVWENNDLGLEAREVHDNALIHGDAFVLVWPDKDGDIQISYESPRQMALVYDVENPRKKSYAVKIWQSAENISRMSIYTADKITKFYANTGEPNEGTQWTLMQTVLNPWGEVPVFHFRTHRPFGRPEHVDAYDAQNAINKLFVTNMHTIDYQGAPQRYALANADGGELGDFDDDKTDTENLANLSDAAGSLWYMKGVSKVGEFSVADAKAFWEPIKDTIRAMSALTDTPLHYFERTGNNPTGNGLRTAEAPLLKKVADRETSFGYSWRDVFRFVLKIEGVPSLGVQVFWKTHESLDELERWDVAAKKINAGLSHRQALREGGYSAEQVDQIMAERQAEADGGLFYARAPQTRVNTDHDETTPKDDDAA
jgi:hypothetical protein